MTDQSHAASVWEDVDAWLSTIKKAVERLPHDVNVRGGDGLEHDRNCLRCAASMAASKLYGRLYEEARRA